MRQRDKTLRTCGCGAQFETIADDPPEACPACTRERNLRNMREWRMRRGEKIAEAHKEWLVVKDPCDTPMAKGARLSEPEVAYGLNCGAWVPGVVFEYRGKKYTATGALTLRCGKLELSSVDCGKLRPADRRRYTTSASRPKP